MRTYIKIDTPLRRRMMETFGVSRKCLFENLNGLVSSERSDEIRTFALANGGRLIRNEEYVPACQTVERADGFAQLFAGGITVLINTKTSTAAILRGGEELHRYEGITMNAWSNILRLAQDYAEGRMPIES